MLIVSVLFPNKPCPLDSVTESEQKHFNIQNNTIKLDELRALKIDH